MSPENPVTFPWVRFLPEADVQVFTTELTSALEAADSADKDVSVAQLLTAWQHTAEIHADPELLTALTRDAGQE
ncbi:hypothetical protein [Streptomyces sp. Amel2xC10]|uniref:hypothetical protein n=1 Tax=Streptomyces sp. Amel2xC10 TaxID=1305826 RepID=UPI000A08EA11|nr:hypothetical protein [Streptomyces sp. Amel2xC10]SMF66672.1 hypothetical protein SAMN02745830_05097 [Streptomyces sp. Amel2xC10]